LVITNNGKVSITKKTLDTFLIMKRIFLLVLFITIIKGNVFAQVQADNYVDGPMIGAVTENSTSVNFILEKGNESNTFYVALKDITQNIVLQATETKEFCLGVNCTYTAVFNNLIPNNKYRAILYKNNVEIERTKTDITVPDNTINDFSFLTGSCAYLYSASHVNHVREDIFEQMTTETNVEFMLWLGDNIYLPNTNLTKQRIYNQYIYYKTESVKRKNFMKYFFHFGIWDDHDYSYDNGTEDFPDKEFSSKMFKRFWPNSGYENQNSGGTYGTYKYEDLEFFLTDVRYYKTRYKHLGKTQLTWLKDKLLQSTATFKFIEIGSATVYPWKNSTSHETSFFQTGERDELFDFIYENNISGVIILSGDKHKTYFGQYSPDCNSTYPIYEFMCSPLSATPQNSNYPYADLFTEIGVNNYGKIDITGNVGNRICTMTAKDISGNILYSLALNENDLKVSASPNINPADFVSAKYNFTGNVQDSSVNGNNAILNGATTTLDRWGNNDQAYLFSAYPNTIDLPNAVLDGKSNFSASFWIKPSENGRGLISASSSTIGNEMLVFLGATNKVSLNIKNSSIGSVHAINLNKWNHVAVTRNGTTGEALIYINGKIEARGTLPAGNLEVVSLLIGNDQDGAGGGNLDLNQQFMGAFDDVVFYDEVLCGLQIIDIYNQDFNQITAITNSIICESSAVDFEVSGASNGNYKWYKTREGNSLINNTNNILHTNISETTTYWVAANNFWRESKREPVTIKVAPTIYDDSEGLTYPSNLFSWYKMDSNANDFTQNNLNGTVTGASLTTDRFGNANAAYQFTNYQDLIRLPNTLLDGAEELTLSFWIKTTSSGDGIISAASSDAGNELLVYISATGSLSIIMNEKSKNYAYSIINDNQWHHIVFSAVCKNGQGVLYVDGVKAITTNNYFGVGELEVPINALIIGNDQDNAGGGGLSTSQQFVGSFDDLKIYRRAISEQEANDIYTNTVKYKEPFSFTTNSLAVCEGDNYTLQFESKQNNIDYFLTDNSSVIVDNGEIINNSVHFSVPILSDETYHIIAKNSDNCEKQFDATFSVSSVESPRPIITVNGNTLCTTITGDNYFWTRDGVNISNNACVEMLGSGVYEVYIVNNPNCTSETASYTNTLSLDDSVLRNGFLVYPTSANSEITVEVNSENGWSYQIIDVLGDVIIKGNFDKNKSTISIANLTKGMYAIVVLTDTQKSVQFFQKK